MSRLHAVITGDLIGSRKQGAAAVDRSIAALADATAKFAVKFSLQPKFTRYRGDGWQIVLEKPKFSFEACASLAASLRAANTGLDSRMAIGIGEVDSLVGLDLSAAAGPAFETSGTLLDKMARHMPERWMIDGMGVGKWPQAVLALAEWVARGWTPAQAEAVAMVLLDTELDTNQRRAASLGITRQAFEARFKGAGLDALMIANGAFGAHNFAAAP